MFYRFKNLILKYGLIVTNLSFFFYVKQNVPIF